MPVLILRAQCIQRTSRALFCARTLATVVAQTGTPSTSPAVLLNRGSGRATFKALNDLRNASTEAANKKSVNVHVTKTPSAAAEEPDAEEEYWLREQVPKPNRTSSFLCRPSATVHSLC